MRAAALLLSLACGLASAETIKGVVVRVIDGDTLVIMGQGSQTHVRLSLIDAPEIRQPYGIEAKKTLEGMTLGREVIVTGRPRDKYGRMLGEVRTIAGSINLVLVRSGSAWAYHTPSQVVDPVAADAEVLARQEGLGLWSQRSTIAPWDWRKGQR